MLGIIGGMGTQATACFYEMLHSMQSVSAEQEYLDILLFSKPSIPDRTAFITGQSTDNPLKSLIHAARTLESAGVSCIAIPCATSHYFYDDISSALCIPVLNMLDETVSFAKRQGLKKVCLLATDGTIRGRFFQNAFEKNGIDVILPPEATQSELMAIIYDVKCGVGVSPDVLDSIIEDALKAGSDAVVLGCTELCAIGNTGCTNETDVFHTTKKSPGIINMLEVLAKASLKFFKY